MKTKLILLATLAALATGARFKAVPTVETTTVEGVAWGDGTFRDVMEIAGSGFAPDALVRVAWSRNGVELWSFESWTDGSGGFTQVWTDVPAGGYQVSAWQVQGRKWRLAVTTNVTVE